MFIMSPVAPDIEDPSADRAAVCDPPDASSHTASPNTDALSAKRKNLAATKNGLESDKPGESDFLQFYF